MEKIDCVMNPTAGGDSVVFLDDKIHRKDFEHAQKKPSSDASKLEKVHRKDYEHSLEKPSSDASKLEKVWSLLTQSSCR
ncbi:unnamed protein product [Heligmosomoides polygyrus]|uniref:Ovule protein n=1 Tax=Heligmosomoides polygyrus TaxID=6339 RepID=A0A183GWE8_HELPZ|nr:unnamed protein product [Heligmosomoides polygyrus]